MCYDASANVPFISSKNSSSSFNLALEWSTSPHCNLPTLSSIYKQSPIKLKNFTFTIQLYKIQTLILESYTTGHRPLTTLKQFTKSRVFRAMRFWFYWFKRENKIKYLGHISNRTNNIEVVDTSNNHWIRFLIACVNKFIACY